MSFSFQNDAKLLRLTTRAPDGGDSGRFRNLDSGCKIILINEHYLLPPPVRRLCNR